MNEFKKKMINAMIELRDACRMNEDGFTTCEEECPFQSYCLCITKDDYYEPMNWNYLDKMKEYSIY